jgi:ATP-dependent RNA helicase DeaD
MPIGRKHNADPKWMIPLICKAGNVTKQEIGAIKIFDKETKFEIASHMAESFQASTSNMKESEPRIEPTTAPTPGRTPYAGTPPSKRPPSDKPPYAAKSGKSGEQQRRRQNKSNSRAPG